MRVARASARAYVGNDVFFFIAVNGSTKTLALASTAKPGTHVYLKGKKAHVSASWDKGWRLAVGGWRLAVGGWRLAVGGGWRLAVGGWRLAVGGPLGLSLTAFLCKKENKSGF